MLRYVSIDIETLGLNPKKCDLIEFGAVIDDCQTPLQFLPRFHTYLLPPRKGSIYRGEPYAMAMHSNILKRIAAREKGYDYIYPDDLPLDFADWLTKHDYKRGSCHEVEIVVAGKNFSGFDWRFLRRIINFDCRIKVHHRVIDPTTMYMDPTKDKAPPGLDECLRRAGIEKEVSHTAVDDALDVIRCLRHKWNVDPKCYLVWEERVAGKRNLIQQPFQSEDDARAHIRECYNECYGAGNPYDPHGEQASYSIEAPNGDTQWIWPDDVGL